MAVMKKPNIKSIPYEEFKDNETFEKLVAELNAGGGTITTKMAPVLKRLYDQMADPKYVVAIGGCSISGGPFTKSYHVVRGVDTVIPVDVYVPGCPPRPESFLYGMMQLQRKVKVENFFGTVNRKEKDPFAPEAVREKEKEIFSEEEQA